MLDIAGLSSHRLVHRSFVSVQLSQSIVSVLNYLDGMHWVHVFLTWFIYLLPPLAAARDYMYASKFYTRYIYELTYYRWDYKVFSAPMAKQPYVCNSDSFRTDYYEEGIYWGCRQNNERTTSRAIGNSIGWCLRVKGSVDRYHVYIGRYKFPLRRGNRKIGMDEDEWPVQLKRVQN